MYGYDSLPTQSIRADGGVLFPEQMAVGASVTVSANAYNFGSFIGKMSITLQLLEHTSLSVPAGTFQDVLHVRWSSSRGGQTETYDQWWARAVGMIKKLSISGESANWELTQYSMPPLGNLVIKPPIAQPSRASVISVGGSSPGRSARPFGFAISGQPGQVVVLEASTDLVNWQPLQTNVLPGAESWFDDPEWTNYPTRFYRLRSP